MDRQIALKKISLIIEMRDMTILNCHSVVVNALVFPYRYQPSVIVSAPAFTSNYLNCLSDTDL